MKTIKKVFFSVMMILAIVIVSGCTAVNPDGQPFSMAEISGLITRLSDFIAGVVALGAAAALVTVMVQLAKLAGLVKDGTAGTWSTVLNAIVLAGLVIFKVINPDLLASDVDEWIRTILSAATLILGFIGIQLPTSAKLYEINRANETPVVGYSLTDASEK